MREKIKPKLVYPDGYELAEAEPRIPDKDKDEFYLMLNGSVYEVKNIKPWRAYFILRKIEPLWKWPSWLKGEFLAVDSLRNILIFSHQPSSAGSAWSHSEGWCIRVNIIIDIEWPEYDRWQDSLVAKSDCKIV